MKKRLQNKVADSWQSLPVVAAYAVGCWLVCGLVQENWWLQFGCLALSAYLMTILSERCALIRVYSRMLPCSFIALSCMACFVFPSLHEAIAQLMVIAAYLILFQTYQDAASAGTTYYGFLCIGLASMADVHILFFLPLMWILMWSCLQTLSWRTFFASLLGILTPYWFAGCWLIYQEDFMPLAEHFAALGDFRTPFDFSLLSIGQIATFILIVVFSAVGAIHFWHTSYLDKIRIRHLYSFFIRMNLLTFLFICLQPQHYDFLIQLAIINTAPLMGHYISLANSRLSNFIFCCIVLLTLALTTYNIWMLLLPF